MSSEHKTITFFNEDGSIKTKEQFVNEATEVYDNVVDSCSCDENNIFNICTTPESQIDIKSTMDTYDFIGKTIDISDDVSPELANKVVKLIRFYNDADRGLDNVEPIVIYINTDGGELYAALSIVAAIEASRTPVYTVNLGKAFSAGFLILIAGHKRFGMPYSSYLFHEGANCIIGDAHKAIQNADYYKKSLQTIKSIILDNTDIGHELYQLHEKDDWWFDVEEAYAMKVIDEIITDFNDIYARKEDDTNESEDS